MDFLNLLQLYSVPVAFNTTRSDAKTEHRNGAAKQTAHQRRESCGWPENHTPTLRIMLSISLSKLHLGTL